MAETLTSGGRRRWIALAVLCLGQLMFSLDTTVVNVALPSIQRSLHFSPASLAWVINAYLITYAGFLLFAGRLGDLVGRKRVFMSGLVVFVVASALCGAAQSSAMLVVARLLQGIGAATSGAVIVAIIVSSFEDAHDRATAIAFLTFTAVAGASIGLLAGGALTEALSWHWIFLINLPIGACALPLAARLLEGHEGIGLGDGVDAVGALLITSALMAGCYAIVEAATHGWASTVTLGGLAGALALIAAFVVREQRTAHPMIALRLFRSRNVSGANVARGLLAFGVFSALFLLSLYLQDRLHYSPLRTGLAFLPMTVCTGLVSLGASARLVSLIGAKRTLLVGYALTLAGLVVLARIPVHGAYAADVLPGVILIGLGTPLGFNPAVQLAMSSVPPADLGVASGLSNVAHQVGGAVGLALVATLSTARARALIAAGHPAANASVAGDHLAFAVTAGLLTAGLLLCALVLRAPERRVTADGDRSPETQASAA